MIREFSKNLLFMSSVFQTFSKINRIFPKIQKKNRKYRTYFNKKFCNNPKKTNSKRIKQHCHFSQIKQGRKPRPPHRLRKAFLTSINEDAPPQKESYLSTFFGISASRNRQSPPNRTTLSGFGYVQTAA